MIWQSISNRVSSLVEKWGSLAVASIAALSSWAVGLDLGSNQSALLCAAVTFGAITSGFVMTSVSLLTSLDTPLIRSIKANRRYFHDLRRYLATSLRSGIVLAGYSIFLLLASKTDGFWAVVFSFVLALCIGYLWRLSRIVLIMFDEDTLGSDPATIDAVGTSTSRALNTDDG